MRVFALTGGTGSGKSAAAKRFIQNGIPVIDADKVGHEVIAKGGIAEKLVIEAFGDRVVSDGSVDRNKLRGLVFSDADARQHLNRIVHPAIMEDIALRCAKLAETGEKAVLIDAALLGENGHLADFFAGLILVSCPAEERLRRLVTYRGMSEEDALAQIKAQTEPELKRNIATWVIENTRGLHALYDRIDEITEAIHALP